MKKTGLVILAIGLIFTVVTGVKFITKEKVVDIGEIEITRDKSHRLSWSPLIGVGIMALGGGMFLVGSKQRA
jgi:hypothetical protein